LSLLPFVVIPVALGSVVTLFLVNVFPARRARDVLMLMGLLFAVSLVLMLRFLRPARLLSIEPLPDLPAFFATLPSPVTPPLSPAGRPRRCPGPPRRARLLHGVAGQEHRRLREPGHGRLRALRGGAPLRLPRRLRGGSGLLDHPQRAGADAQLPVVQVLDRS